jgi:RloB-like protein
MDRTRLLDRKHDKRTAKIIIIATEGKHTEKQYFESFITSPRLKIQILPTEDNNSDPQSVLNRVNIFTEKFDLGKEDSIWLVLDVDRWGDRKLSQICREAKQKKYGLAISNPCFEVWLWLHFDDLDPFDKTCKDFENKLRQKLGSYNKSNLITDRYQSHIPNAVERSKALHPSNSQAWPPTIGSHVHRLIAAIKE